MWSFLLTIILTVLFIFVFYIGWKYDNLGCALVGGIIGFCAAIVFIIMIISLPTLEDDFSYTKEKYYNLKHQVEYVKKDEIVTSENLRNQVLEMNNTISSHKIYCDNWFIGMWYSPEIGNLQKLEWQVENTGN